MNNDYSIFPKTGRKTVLLDYDELNGWSKLCMETGFGTMKRFILDTPEELEFKNTLPEYIVNQRYVEENNQVWYKTIIMSSSMILFPDLGDTWMLAGTRLVEPDEDVSNLQTVLFDGKLMCVELFDNPVVFENFTQAFETFMKIENLKNEN